MERRNNLRSIAIVAHVDHGKTTLVDAIFKQGGLYRAGQVAMDRLLDSNDQERERGITIMAKVTAINFGETTLQIVDTPGHADFGGEVERGLRMVDGVVLLVDAAEGPLPQTRFVLRKTLELQLPVVLVINKIDRQDARPLQVLDEVYDLFIDLGASEEQLNFPILYTNGRAGVASLSLEEPGVDLQPLVKAILETIPAPLDTTEEPFCLQVNQLGYDDYVGRLAIGRILSGKIKPNQTIQVKSATTPGSTLSKRITGVFTFRGLARVPLNEASAGEIVALAGLDEVGIGDTLAAPLLETALPPIVVDEPTVAMVLQVNDGPLAGKSGGKYLTSRHLGARLKKEAYANVAIRVEATDFADQFRVFGRGELQLAVLLESLRREGFELCARNPEVVTRVNSAGITEEPTERLVVDVPVEHAGVVAEIMGKRRGQILDQRQEGSRMRLEYVAPTRSLFGLRGYLLTATRGSAILHSIFEGWTAWTGPMIERVNGALVADREGLTTPYALFNLQPRGILFVGPGVQVYKGMIVGEHNRENDLHVHACREKKLTNIRAAGKDDNVLLAPPREMTLDKALEWIRSDEMVEITPLAIRMRKRTL